MTEETQFAAISEAQRGQMVSGMRWTLWLSVACAPLGFVTAVLLGRVDPRVLGTFSLLTLYIALTSVFLFFGGNGVAIKFLPEIEPGKRGAFLVTYLAITLIAVLPYQLAGTIWPRGLQYVLGKDVSPQFAILLVWVAPLYILFSLVLSGLKGLLDIKWAQIYNRIVTLSNFVVYAALFAFARSFLRVHYSGIIWSLYLVLALVVMFVAGKRLLANLGKEAIRNSLHFVLPQGFWRYTGSLQANCMLDFFSQRLDYIFILNVGGTYLLGLYGAILTLVSVIPTFATFVLDSLLPSLTTTLASRDLPSARHITEAYLRFMLPCGVVAATFATLFAHPIFGLFGPKYSSLAALGLIAFPVAAIQVMNWFAGTMFTAVGDPHLPLAAKSVRCVVYCAAFFPLWHRYHLLGAILAWAAGEISDQIILLILLWRKTPFRFSCMHAYSVFLGCVCVAALAAAAIGPNRLAISSGVWIALIAAFFVAARYSVREIRELAHLVLPSRVSALLN